MFKIFKGFYDINHKKKFQSSTELRSHDFKLYKPQVNLDIRNYFFSNRVADKWNSLPVSFLKVWGYE